MKRNLLFYSNYRLNTVQRCHLFTSVATCNFAVFTKDDIVTHFVNEPQGHKFIKKIIKVYYFLLLIQNSVLNIKEDWQ